MNQNSVSTKLVSTSFLYPFGFLLCLYLLCFYFDDEGYLPRYWTIRGCYGVFYIAVLIKTTAMQDRVMQDMEMQDTAMERRALERRAKQERHLHAQ